MMGNKKVKENNQGGIDRVKQKKGDMEKGKGGRMGEKVDKAEWSRTGATTPRKA